MTQAHFDLLGKILRSANRQPLVGALACQPSLGRNHQTFGERRKGLAKAQWRARRNYWITWFREEESGIQSEPDLHCHLPVLNLVINDMSTHFGDFKPTHVTDCFTGSIYRVVHRVFDAFGRGTDQLNLFVDVVTHNCILVGSGHTETGKSGKEVAIGVVCSAGQILSAGEIDK
jgi:hypothetical protein